MRKPDNSKTFTVQEVQNVIGRNIREEGIHRMKCRQIEEQEKDILEVFADVAIIATTRKFVTEKKVDENSVFGLFDRVYKNIPEVRKSAGYLNHGEASRVMNLNDFLEPGDIYVEKDNHHQLLEKNESIQKLSFLIFVAPVLNTPRYALQGQDVLFSCMKNAFNSIAGSEKLQKLYRKNKKLTVAFPMIGTKNLGFKNNSIHHIMQIALENSALYGEEDGELRLILCRQRYKREGQKSTPKILEEKGIDLEEEIQKLQGISEEKREEYIKDRHRAIRNAFESCDDSEALEHALAYLDAYENMEEALRESDNKNVLKWQTVPQELPQKARQTNQSKSEAEKEDVKKENVKKEDVTEVDLKEVYNILRDALKSYARISVGPEKKDDDIDDISSLARKIGCDSSAKSIRDFLNHFMYNETSKVPSLGRNVIIRLLIFLGKDIECINSTLGYKGKKKLNPKDEIDKLYLGFLESGGMRQENVYTAFDEMIQQVERVEKKRKEERKIKEEKKREENKKKEMEESDE